MHKLNQAFACSDVVAAPPRLRILHITEAQLGGVMTCLQEMLGAQASHADIESVCALVPNISSAALQAVSPPNVKIQSFRYTRRSIGALWRLAITARQVLQENDPDIVHLHSTLAGAIVRLCLITLRKRPKIVYCPHGWFFTRPGSTAVAVAAAAVERLLANTTDGILCVSNHERQQAIAAGIPASRCFVVTNGIAEIDAPSTNALPIARRRGGKLKVLFVGRFDRQKGFDVYMEVMRRLEDIADGVAVGSFILNKAKPLVCPANVTLIDWRSRDELHRIYKSADLLIVPSRWEAFGFVAAEAMRAGVPVFASRVGGLPELVLDNVTGRLFDSENVEQITQLIRSASRPVLEEYGRRGYARFLKNFTAARMNEGLFQYYRLMACSD